MENKVKFYSLIDRPKCEASPSGHGVYEYQYLEIDPDTKAQSLKSNKRNVFEEIQSCSAMVDYKKKIKEGEKFEDDGTGLYLDMSELEPGLGGFDDYINCVVARVRQQLAQENQTVKQSNSVEQTAEAQAKVAEKSAKTGVGVEGGDTK